MELTQSVVEMQTISTTMTGETILRATDIEHSYGLLTVLEGVSVSVDSGTVTALVGPNGSGKTTLIRALAGLHEPSEGTIAYEGSETIRRRGYLPQRPAFRPGQSVLDALTFYASLVGETERDAMATLERVGLEDAADREVSALSGGMTRLVGIAQATLGDPPVIILDEPASGLDPEMSLHIFDVLSTLAERGTAILLSSHDLALVEETADKVLILDDGTIVRRGPPDEMADDIGVGSLLETFKSSISGEPGTVLVREETV